MKKNRLFQVKKSTLFLLLFCLFSACTLQSPALHQAELQKAYHSAIVDAATAEPAEISNTLVAIVPSNDKLIWKNRDDAQNAMLLVVTWTNYNGYDDKIGQSLQLSREVWVTTAPEIKNFCKKLNGNRALRLEQLLGLPANAGKTKFVEMWVKPGDLFRPSADPEISDREAETEFRKKNIYVTVSDDYVKWFNELKIRSYSADGYPWTRLGYTYDWGDHHRHIGLSEFVIMPGATVEIKAISATMNY